MWCTAVRALPSYQGSAVELEGQFMRDAHRVLKAVHHVQVQKAELLQYEVLDGIWCLSFEHGI